jgi:hypothetical protein
MLLDSGAFTALSQGKPIDVQEYITFLKRWEHRITRYAALDVIGEPEASRVNLFAMLEAGLKPMPVFVTGEKQDWLNELYEYSDIVAIPLSKPVSPSMAIRRKFMEVRMGWAAGRKVHWFGFTEQKSIEKWKPFACDSTGWLTAALYGWMNLYLGNGQWKRASLVSIRSQSRLRSQVMRAAVEAGYNREAILDEKRWRRNIRKGQPASWHIPYQLSIGSFVRYVRDIRRRFGTWHYLSVEPLVSDAFWLYQHIIGSRIPEMLECVTETLERLVSGESSRPRVRRTGQRGSAVQHDEAAARGPRRVRRLRTEAREGAGRSEDNLFET